MKIFKENELLTIVQHLDILGSNLSEEFIGEEKKGCLHFRGKVFSTVINSMPLYCRMEKENANDEQWVTYIVNKNSSVIKNGQYESICPKVAWGFTAYMISVCRGIISINEKQCFNINIFEAYNSYYNRCLSFFKEEYKNHIEYYSNNNMRDDINKLIDNFIVNHSNNERELLEKTKKGGCPLIDMENFFSITEGYFLFVEGHKTDNQKQRNTKEQDGYKWIIGKNDSEKKIILEELKKDIGANKAAIACQIIKRYFDAGKIHKPTYAQINREFPNIGAESGFYNQLAIAFSEKPRVKYHLD